MEERKRTLGNMKICRFCFSEDEKELTSIYNKEAKSVPLPIQIMSCISIEVFAGDGLPSLICNRCKTQTNQSYIFKSNCRKADDAFKNYLETGHLIKPEAHKTPSQPQRKISTKVSPLREVKNVAKRTLSGDTETVKRQKLEDGTEIITLCITDSVDDQNQDEASRDTEQEEELHLSEEDDSFQESSSYVPPPKAVEVETGVFLCNICGKAFPLKQLLDIHETTDHRARPFACEKCGMSFFSKDDLTKHEQTHSTMKPYCCSVCLKDFNRLSLLRRHEKVHTDSPSYTCFECNRSFLGKDDLETHMKKHSSSKPFACEECGRTFVFKQGLDRHMDSSHSSGLPYKCSYCEAGFSTSVRLKKHVTEHAGLRPYRCKICHRSFLLSHHLTRHLRSHYDKEPGVSVGQYKCDICSMSFKKKDSLINHSAIHSMVNLKCVICNTKFESAKMVKDHITTHLLELPYPCEKCDYSFDTHKQLVEHEVKHAEIEYEEQIEKEVSTEFRTRQDEPKIVDYDEQEDETEEGIQNYHNDGKEVSHFHISNIDDQEADLEVMPKLTSTKKTPKRLATQQKKEVKQEVEDGLNQFFSIDNDEGNEVDPMEVAEQESEDNDIKPIYRMEGIKMYERKGPARRKLHEMENMETIEHTIELEDIDEPPPIDEPLSIDAVPMIPTENLNSSSPKDPVNYKVGDKVVKVQKFIISKDEMKEMAKMGILEVRKGQVIMKHPGQPILNAKIKQVQQSDIESLLQGQKGLMKSPVRQYRRASSSASTDHFAEMED
ncbi:unnamed protein product [Ceutorhynchus assimilis]|uniref:Uncharacterized protein n=1 Tax=Ceutorhynchus assimilis TaxID=467358 RepID=A0A9N9QRS6_9CUCU|nr:unnamed protein product [Ceutorhynchus assimilis]